MARSEQFPPEPSSIPAARWMVSESLERSDDADLALLLASELSANAVQHARTPFCVTVRHGHDGELTIEVRDDDPTAPVMGPPPAPTTIGGRGLRIVDAFAREWGVTMQQGDGKTVWFRLPPLD